MKFRKLAKIRQTITGLLIKVNHSMMTMEGKLMETENNRALVREITNFLRELGMPTHLLGFEYVRLAIYLVYENQIYKKRITTQVYPIIAEKYNTDPQNVERSIRHAIEVAFTRGNVDDIYRLFKNTVSSTKSRPTNAEFISMLADHIHIVSKNF
jgi:two-component system response regulator (stage 0 sporulation protein A)